jgi:hypothetical protein
VAPFCPLVEQELREQRDRFDDMVDRCIENETCTLESTMGDQQLVSGATVDLFVLIGQTMVSGPLRPFWRPF